MTTIADVPLPLRTRLVQLAVHEVRAGNWTPERAARELRWIGLPASGPRVAAAAATSGVASAWLVHRIAAYPRWDVLEQDCPTHGRAA